MLKEIEKWGEKETSSCFTKFCSVILYILELLKGCLVSLVHESLEMSRTSLDNLEYPTDRAPSFLAKTLGP